MSVQTKLKMTVIPTLFVPTLKDLTFVVVKEDILEMDKIAQVNSFSISYRLSEAFITTM